MQAASRAHPNAGFSVDRGVAGSRTFRDPYRTGTIMCPFARDPTNGEAPFPEVDESKFKVISGGKWFTDGYINFTAPTFDNPWDSPDGSYRTVCGPSVPHNAVVYAKCAYNSAVGFLRMNVIRSYRGTQSVEYDAFLKRRQVGFIKEHVSLLEKIARIYAEEFSDWTDLTRAALEHYDDAHPKRLLRMHAMAELKEAGCIAGRLWFPHRERVAIKLKPGEYAKFGKIIRNIADLGVSASLQGAWVTKSLKRAMAMHMLKHRDVTIEFCDSPSQAKLRRVFENLIDPPGRGYFVYFSDDSSLALRVGGVVRRWNMDISKCDASQGPGMFEALRRITPACARPDVDVLVDQCRLPLCIDNPEAKRNGKVGGRERILLKCDDPMLFSGSTLTTVINNVANLLLAISIAETGALDAVTITQAVENVGFIVTLEPAHDDDWRGLQFLKHSPVLDTDGAVQPMLNLGVLLRSSGRCHGDLPAGPGTLADRARRFQGALVYGMYPRTHFTLRDNLLANALPPDAASTAMVAKKLKHKVGETDADFHVTDDEVYRRYDLTPMEVTALNELFGNAGYRGVYCDTGTSKILHADYGLDNNADPE